MSRLALISVNFLLVGSAAAQEAAKKDEAPPAKESAHAQVVTRMLDVLDKLNTSLATIKDQETAAAARPELGKLAKEWKAVRDQAEKLPPPARPEKERLEKDFKEKIELAQRILFGQVTRVQRVPGGPAVLEEIRSVIRPSAK